MGATSDRWRAVPAFAKAYEAVTAERREQERHSAKDLMAARINRAPSPIMDFMVRHAMADIRETERRLGLPPATMP